MDVKSILWNYRVKLEDWNRVRKHKAKVKRGEAAPSVTLVIQKTSHEQRQKVLMKRYADKEVKDGEVAK